MAEVINTNVFDAEKKFVDFAGLDYFWEKAKDYVDDADKVIDDKVVALEGVVGDSTKGLIKDFNDLKAYTESLGDIEGGEGLGGMIDSKIAALDVEDAAVEGQYVSSVAEVDGKVVVSRAALPVYEEVGVAASAAAQALTDAKAYVDGIVGDVTGEDGEVIKGLDSRVSDLEAVDYDQLAADAAAAAVAGVIDEAPAKFDTLKEIAAWIAEADTAEDAASLVTRVSALEAIDHDAYVEADKTVLADAKAYAEGLVMVEGVAKFDAAGAAATAKSEAIADAEGKYQPKGDYEPAGALDAAKAYADGLIMADGVAKFDAAGSAAAAQAAAIAQAKLDAAAALEAYYTKTDVDGLLSTNSAADQAYAKTYTDQLFNSIKFADDKDIDGLFPAKTE